MKKKILIICYFVLSISYVFSFSQNHNMEKISRVRYAYKDILGYVYFEGFNFLGYEAESDGIEIMLEKTLELLQKYYGPQGVIAPNHPFVFVGHSQGGLRVLAMSTYLKQKDPTLYKQLKGIVTLSGIDRGLKLLEENGSNFRAQLYTDTKILTNGVLGIVKLVDFIPMEGFEDLFFYNLIKTGLGDAAWIVLEYILGDKWDVTNDFAYPIMYNTDWDGHAQIRDMVPKSDFIEKYVVEENSIYKQHKSKTSQYLTIAWKKGLLGIKYPVLTWKSKPIVVKTQQVDMKVDKTLPITFLAGTNSNTLSLLSDEAEKKTRTGVEIGEAVFRSAEYLHYAKCALVIGFFTGSPAASADCNKAANWCDSVDYQIGELIGEQTHDGLVALSSQYLPTKTFDGTGYDTQVLTNSKKIEYPNHNHETIANNNSDSKKFVDDYVLQLLGH